MGGEAWYEEKRGKKRGKRKERKEKRERGRGKCAGEWQDLNNNKLFRDSVKSIAIYEKRGEEKGGKGKRREKRRELTLV